jgi:hypothetical protein
VPIGASTYLHCNSSTLGVYRCTCRTVSYLPAVNPLRPRPTLWPKSDYLSRRVEQEGSIIRLKTHLAPRLLQPFASCNSTVEMPTKPASNRHCSSISHVVTPKDLHRCDGIYWVSLVMRGYDRIECGFGRAPRNIRDDRMAPRRHEASRE